MVELAREKTELEARVRTMSELPRDACESSVPAVWGVLNVTPDSFSDGGAYLAHDRAIAAGLAMVEAGASVIDVGGESTRPSGKTYGEVRGVSLEDELARVIPVVRALVARGACVSIDTTKPEVAAQACGVGARYINDVSCGRIPSLLTQAAQAGVDLVLMHNRGQGERSGDNVRYGDVVTEVQAELLAAVARAVDAGVARARIWIDPGIGFAKTVRQSLALLARIDALVATGQKVLVGPSRKSFIAELAKDPRGEPPPALSRLGGTAATVATAVLLGAHAVRVHDVAEMRQAALLGLALREARG